MFLLPDAHVTYDVNQDPCPLVKGVHVSPLSDKDWNMEQYLGRLHLMFLSSPLTQTGGVCGRSTVSSPWFIVRSIGLQLGVHVMTVKSYVTVDLLQSLCAYRWIYL